MAEIVNVAGATPIKVGTGTAGALELLGYTRDGCQIIFEQYTHEVKHDGNGGESGPPSDIQHLGEIARIRLELTKFDEAVADKIRPRLLGGEVGKVGAPGTLIVAGGKSFRMLCHSATRPLNFPIVVFNAPHEINKGTKFSTWVLEGMALKNESTGVLFDTTTTG